MSLRLTGLKLGLLLNFGVALRKKGCGLKIMYISKKDISRRDAKAQSKGEEERQIKEKQLGDLGRALRWLDRPLLFLPFASLRLCASVRSKP